MGVEEVFDAAIHVLVVLGIAGFLAVNYGLRRRACQYGFSPTPTLSVAVYQAVSPLNFGMDAERPSEISLPLHAFVFQCGFAQANGRQSVWHNIDIACQARQNVFRARRQQNRAVS